MLTLDELWRMAAEIAIVRTEETPPGTAAATLRNPAGDPPYIILIPPETKEMGEEMEGFALVHELAHIARMDLLRMEEIEQLAQEEGVPKEKAELAWRFAAEVFCNHAPRYLFHETWKTIDKQPGFVTWSKVREKIRPVAPHLAAYETLPWAVSTLELARLLLKANEGDLESPCGDLLCTEGCHQKQPGSGAGDDSDSDGDGAGGREEGHSDCEHHGPICSYDITKETLEELARRLKAERALNRILSGGKRAGNVPAQVEGAHARTEHDRELERAVALVMERLRRVMSDSVLTDERRRSWMREGRSPLLRGRIRMSIPPIALCIDASGSTADLEPFLNGLAQAIGPRATVIVWDADIRAVFPAGGRIKPIMSAGGTDPLCLVPELEKMRPAGVIVVTDGYCYMPTSKFAKWPTIVVTTEVSPEGWDGELIKVAVGRGGG
jgi:hypothetical protein